MKKLLKIELFDYSTKKYGKKKSNLGGKYIKIIYNLLIKMKLKTTSPGQQKMHLLKISKSLVTFFSSKPLPTQPKPNNLQQLNSLFLIKHLKPPLKNNPN